MSPVPRAGDHSGNGASSLIFGWIPTIFTTNANVLLQIITAVQLLHFVQLAALPKLSRTISSRFLARPSSLTIPLGICTLGVVIAYALRIRPLEQDMHFLTLTSKIPHPPISEEELHGGWYDAALVTIFASAFMQVQRLSSPKFKSHKRLLTDPPASSSRRNDTDTSSWFSDIRTGNWNTSFLRDVNWMPDWAVVAVGLVGAIALAAMRSPLLETFLGGDFNKERRLSGTSTLVAFLLLLWRGVTFLDIISTTISLGGAEEKDKVVLALWQRASLPIAAELAFDTLSILFYESITFKTFTRDEAGHPTAGIHVFDSSVAIALWALGVALAKVYSERNSKSSPATSNLNAPDGSANGELGLNSFTKP
ncbi:hypothetical protein CPB86DRAFT_876020 [Serendipita vermifera]|nr:hypothetical protein CPB86DRAFT_876020 [Serendipita vermifera]